MNLAITIGKDGNVIEKIESGELSLSPEDINIILNEKKYIINLKNFKIISAIIQPNNFEYLLIPQYIYIDGGVQVKFSTFNSEIRTTDFTIIIYIKPNKSLPSPPPSSSSPPQSSSLSSPPQPSPQPKNILQAYKPRV